MPIYLYKCTECNHKMEALQKMSDNVLTDCPVCATPSLQKQITAAAFKLKGTGWYETDFKNSGKKPEPTASKGSSDKDATSSKDKPLNNNNSDAKTTAGASN